MFILQVVSRDRITEVELQNYKVVLKLHPPEESQSVVILGCAFQIYFQQFLFK